MAFRDSRLSPRGIVTLHYESPSPSTFNQFFIVGGPILRVEVVKPSPNPSLLPGHGTGSNPREAPGRVTDK